VSTAALLTLEGVRRVYGETVAVDTVDLTVPRGAFTVLLGPSGSGKTTLLSMIGGFVDPSAGRIAIEGRDVTGLPPARRPTATVFQDYALFPHRDVEGNVAFGLESLGLRRAEREARVAECLALVGLPDHGRRRIHALSGGQRQRVALARALAVSPSVLLLDEPLGALDLALRRQMQAELVGLQKRLGTTFVHVTHDQDEAMSIADTVVVMNAGRIEDCGPPERVYRRPASLFAARFMGESTILDVVIKERRGGAAVIEGPFGKVTVPDDGHGGTGPRASVCLRPECLAAAPSCADSVPLGPLRIVECRFQGAHRRAVMTFEEGPDTPLIARLPLDVEAEPGSRTTLYLRPDDLVLLEPE